VINKRPFLVARAAGTKLWRHDGAWPRNYLTRQLQRAPDSRQLQLLAKLAEKPFGAHNHPAVVAAGVFPTIANAPLTSADRVTGWRHTFNTVTVDVDASAPSVLVNSEVLYPGWRGFVNGKPVRIEQTNYLFRGVEVPPGKSTIQFVYDSATYRCAIFISLCGLAVLAMASVSFHKRHAARYA
jgi:hypothetical protein